MADIGFHSTTAPSQPGIDSGAAKTLERKPTGQTRIWTAATISGRPATMASRMPTQSIANRNRSSSPNAPSAAAAPWCQRQPTAYPTPVITASPAVDWSMSAALRPTRTAPGTIGMERKRSMTPLPRSWVTASIVLSRPKAMVSASIPGTRNSVGSPSTPRPPPTR